MRETWAREIKWRVIRNAVEASSQTNAAHYTNTTIKSARHRAVVRCNKGNSCYQAQAPGGPRRAQEGPGGALKGPQRSLESGLRGQRNLWLVS
jgi:hypothetical protein